MTTQLEKVFAQAAQLPETAQDALAAVVLEEMESQEKWGASFARSQNLLSGMAQQALEEHANGETQPLGAL